MITIKIDTDNPVDWLYANDDWKDYIDPENFDETYVIAGNLDYTECAEASWYKKVIDIIDRFDLYCEREDFDDLDDKSYNKVKKIYDDARNPRDFDVIIKFLAVLYPDDTFKTATLHGYVQREWNDVLYKANVPHDIDLLDAIYMGKIYDIYWEEEGVGSFVTHDQMWKAERDGKVRELMIDKFDLPEDEEIKIYKSNGYHKVLDWVEI